MDAGRQPQDTGFDLELLCRVSDALAAERTAIQSHLQAHHDTVLAILEAELKKSSDIFTSNALSDDRAPVSIEDSPLLNQQAPVNHAAVNPKPLREQVREVSSHDDTKAALSFNQARSLHGLLWAVVDNLWFEAIFIVVILVSTIISALQSQYKGLDIGYDIGYPGMRSPAEEVWPGAHDVFLAFEYTSAGLYTLELCLKLAAHRCSFFKQGWNIFDTLVVGQWYVTHLIGGISGLTFLRLVRLVRLMRLVRHAGWFSAFDSLHMLITAIRSSVSVFVWATLLLGVLLVLFALLMSGLLGDFLRGDNDVEKKRQVYAYFGTFTRSFISVFEISFASHAPICRIIMENAGEGYAIYFLVFKCFVGLSVMRVITGIFLHETFKVCSEDDELMVIRRKRASELHAFRMNKLFQKADADGDARLSWEEFEDVLKDNWVRAWLGAIELDSSNVKRLWRLLDDGDGKLTAEELINGVARLKGGAKCVDLMHLLGDVDRVNDSLTEICDKVHKTHTHAMTHAQHLSNLSAQISKTQKVREQEGRKKSSVQL